MDSCRLFLYWSVNTSHFIIFSDTNANPLEHPDFCEVRVPQSIALCNV